MITDIERLIFRKFTSFWSYIFAITKIWTAPSVLIHWSLLNQSYLKCKESYPELYKSSREVSKIPANIEDGMFCDNSWRFLAGNIYGKTLELSLHL